MKVVPATDNLRLERATVYIAPPDMHMRLAGDSIALDRGPKEHRTRPAIDPLFVSAARAFGNRVVGALLSGGGEDGVVGLIEIKKAGGLSLVQDPAEAAHSSMPRAALRGDDVDAVFDAAKLGRVLYLLATGEAVNA